VAFFFNPFARRSSPAETNFFGAPPSRPRTDAPARPDGGTARPHHGRTRRTLLSHAERTLWRWEQPPVPLSGRSARTSGARWLSSHLRMHSRCTRRVVHALCLTYTMPGLSHIHLDAGTGVGGMWLRLPAWSRRSLACWCGLQGPGVADRFAVAPARPCQPFCPTNRFALRSSAAVARLCGRVRVLRRRLLHRSQRGAWPCTGPIWRRPPCLRMAEPEGARLKKVVIRKQNYSATSHALGSIGDRGSL